MNENLEAVKRRVKKLFALSKSPNENEAMAALEKVLALMDEYHLTEGQCLYVKQPVKATKRLSKWRAVLSNAVAWLYCCETYRKKSAGEIVFYGESFDASVAGEMYGYLSKTVEHMAKQNIRKNASREYREKYRLGVACRLNARIHDLGAAAAWMEVRGNKLRTVEEAMKKEIAIVTTDLKITGRGDNAFKRGAAAGDGIALNRQTTGHGGRFLEGKHDR
jgi:hypothetical protein